MKMNINQLAERIEDRSQELGLTVSATALVGPDFLMHITNHDSGKEYMINHDNRLCLVKISVKRDCDKVYKCKDGSHLHYTDRSLSPEASTTIEVVRDICHINNVSDVVDMFFE